jgi:hypothetical protein
MILIILSHFLNEKRVLFRIVIKIIYIIEGVNYLSNKKYNDVHRINEQDLEEKQCKNCKEWLLMNNTYFNIVNKKKDKFNDRCRICQDIYQKIYYSKTADRQREKANKRRLEKLPEITEYFLQYYQDNKETMKAKNKIYKKERPDYYKELSKKFRNSEHGRERCKIYNKKHKEKKHQVTEKEWEDCKKYFNHKCAYCGLPIEEHYYTRNNITKLGDFHKEHVVDDGKNDLRNCVPSCGSCNSSKREYSLHTWYNPKNPIYDSERYHKLYMWIRYDHKKYIKQKKLKHSK